MSFAVDYCKAGVADPFVACCIAVEWLLERSVCVFIEADNTLSNCVVTEDLKEEVTDDVAVAEALDAVSTYVVIAPS